ARDSRWKWFGAATVAAVAAFLFSHDLNALMVFQAPVAVAACWAAAAVLLRAEPARRTVGTKTTAFVLIATGTLWAFYFAAFGNSAGFFAIPLGPIATPLLAYNSYSDMLLIVMLGFAMLMVFMEEARRRFDDVQARLGALIRSAPD